MQLARASWTARAWCGKRNSDATSRNLACVSPPTARAMRSARTLRGTRLPRRRAFSRRGLRASGSGGHTYGIQHGDRRVRARRVPQIRDPSKNRTREACSLDDLGDSSYPPDTRSTSHTRDRNRPRPAPLAPCNNSRRLYTSGWPTCPQAKHAGRARSAGSARPPWNMCSNIVSGVEIWKAM
jgi:hypothetical protein